jgi:hypothetical protein
MRKKKTPVPREEKIEEIYRAMTDRFRMILDANSAAYEPARCAYEAACRNATALEIEVGRQRALRQAGFDA